MRGQTILGEALSDSVNHVTDPLADILFVRLVCAWCVEVHSMPNPLAQVRGKFLDILPVAPFNVSMYDPAVDNLKPCEE
jgi:hypothetical protein